LFVSWLLNKWGDLMIGLPKSTEFNKRIPKQKFYENITVSPTLKRLFVEQIKIIYWRNKIAHTTVNILQGKEVKEIEVFEIALNQPKIDESILQQIDKEIPYHIIFVLTFDGKYQVWISYKEATENGKNAFNVSNYYHTGWLEKENIKLLLDGLNTDTIYENFVKQVAGDKLRTNSSESLKTSIEKAKQRENIEKRISVLENKIRKEKQLNKQMEMKGKLKKLKKELDVI
jgi:hypothetical protein